MNEISTDVTIIEVVLEKRWDLCDSSSNYTGIAEQSVLVKLRGNTLDGW